MSTKILMIASGVYIALAIGVVMSMVFGQFNNVDFLIQITQFVRSEQYEWALILSYFVSTAIFSIDVVFFHSMSMSRKIRWVLLFILLNLMVHRTYIKHFRNV